MMFVALFAVVFVGVGGRELVEPKFRVLTPDELMVEVPHYEDMGLVTFRIGVRRKFNDQEDLELGQNAITSDRIYIYDERLNLKRDDVVNYLLVFKDKGGYQPQTGKYTFDGVYLKKPFGRRQRFRRFAETSTENSELSTTDETETVDPAIESRFGHHHHHNHHWPEPDGGFNPFRPGGRPGFGPPGLNPSGFGPPGRGPPPFVPGRGPPNYPYPGYGPRGDDCNDHRHDKCHETEPAKWEKSTKKPVIPTTEYHCRMCQKVEIGRSKMSTTENPATSSDYPDIDIRFSDD